MQAINKDLLTTENLLKLCLQSWFRSINNHLHFQYLTRARTDMVKPTTLLLTVFTNALEVLESEACNYSKGCYISTRLRCVANHNALGQLANQSTLSFAEGGAL